MATARKAQAIARTCGIVLLAMTAAYLLLAVLPFYGNGIHMHSYQEIAGSMVDVKGYPPFAWLGGPAQGIAMLAAGYVLPMSLVLVPVLVATLLARWHSFGWTEVKWWDAVCVANVVTLAMTFESYQIILTWLVD